MIIRFLTTDVITVTTVPPVLVTFIDKPRRPPLELTFPALVLQKPTLSLIAVPQIAVETAVRAVAQQALVPDENPDPLASGVESNAHGTSSTVSGGASSSGVGVPTITIAHRVQPIYSDASVRAEEQGCVVAGILIDERGHVSKVEVVQSSGFRRLDQSVVNALRQWTFTRHANGSRPIPAWTKIAYGFHLTSSNTLDLSTIAVTLVPFEPAVAEQIHAAAVPTVGTHIPTPSGADALRHLIATIRTVALRYDQDLRGPLPPIHLLAKLGAVQSIQFLGIESRGLDVNEATQTIDPGSRDSRKLQWELYKVTQQGGVSEWLIAVTRNGTIKIAQALTCPASCPSF
jgi:TonB family protein